MVLPKFKAILIKPQVSEKSKSKKLYSRSHSAINFIKKNKVTTPSFIRPTRFNRINYQSQFARKTKSVDLPKIPIFVKPVVEKTKFLQIDVNLKFKGTH